MKLLDDAIIYAATAHGGQRRKYTNLPYITHPIEVMGIVRTVGHTEEMLAAAVLHDVVEDTASTLEDLTEAFGSTVSRLVEGLTEVWVEGNRATRKQAEVLRLAKESAEVQTIKLADLISNTADIVAYDPSFAKIYLAEKMELLKVLTRGDRQLHARASAQLQKEFADA